MDAVTSPQEIDTKYITSERRCCASYGRSHWRPRGITAAVLLYATQRIRRHRLSLLGRVLHQSQSYNRRTHDRLYEAPRPDDFTYTCTGHGPLCWVLLLIIAAYLYHRFALRTYEGSQQGCQTTPGQWRDAMTGSVLKLQRARSTHGLVSPSPNDSRQYPSRTVRLLVV